MLILSQSCDREGQTCDCQGLSHMSSLASSTDHLGRERWELQEEGDSEPRVASAEATGSPSSELPRALCGNSALGLQWSVQGLMFLLQTFPGNSSGGQQRSPLRNEAQLPIGVRKWEGEDLAVRVRVCGHRGGA